MRIKEKKQAGKIIATNISNKLYFKYVLHINNTSQRKRMKNAFNEINKEMKCKVEKIKSNLKKKELRKWVHML